MIARHDVPLLAFHGQLALGGHGVLRPSYRVTPFSRPRESPRLHSATDGALMRYLADRFPGRAVALSVNGRSALGAALREIALQPTDVVTIFTTSGKHYVSGCVTREIDAVCRWSRDVVTETRAALVIHEFGYPMANMASIRALGVPVIEDCCYAFASSDSDGLLGLNSDFAVFSFPKFFDTPFGGALIGLPTGQSLRYEGIASEETLRAITNIVDSQVELIATIADARARNFSLLRDRLRDHGCTPSLPEHAQHVPGVFLFDAPPGHDLQALKRQLYTAGVECSVHYHSESFFVPVHQNLRAIDLEYIAAAVGAGLSGLLGEVADA